MGQNCIQLGWEEKLVIQVRVHDSPAPSSYEKTQQSTNPSGKILCKGQAELMEMVAVELEETLDNEALCTITESFLKTKQSVVFLFLP